MESAANLDFNLDLDSNPPIMQKTGTSSTTSGGTKTEYLFKVLVIGELGTGKTSFIKRYVHNFYSENYRATIGVDFALKVLSWNESTVIRLQLWDIAGQERFGNMTRVYYKDAVGAFLLFDVTRNDSFKAVEKWKSDLDDKVLLPDGRPIPCVLVGNKCDMPRTGQVANDAAMESFAKDKGFVGWFPASAKENINVDEAAKALVEKVMDNEKWRSHHSGPGGGSSGSRRRRDLHDSSQIMMLEEDTRNNNARAKTKTCAC